jgi:GTPase
MLVDPSEDRLHHLTTQLKWRVLEGQGEAIYAIGARNSQKSRFLVAFTVNTLVR